MAFITYSKKEKVNIKVMDKQHKEMTEIINSLYEYLIKKKAREIKSTLKSLSELLIVHFEYEELLMKQTKFQGYYSHKLEHDRFLAKTNKYIDSVLSGKTMLEEDFLLSAKNWFFNHLEINDKKCGAYFVEQGIK